MRALQNAISLAWRLQKGFVAAAKVVQKPHILCLRFSGFFNGLFGGCGASGVVLCSSVAEPRHLKPKS